jgi:hypothetical protein
MTNVPVLRVTEQSLAIALNENGGPLPHTVTTNRATRSASIRSPGRRFKFAEHDLV